MSSPEISPVEANIWWRTTQVTGVFLNRMMLALVLAPVALVLYGYTYLSLVAFASLIPYGLLLRRLAVRAVRREIRDRPEAALEFEQAGIVVTRRAEP